ncbi:SRC kinase signaling inhibitor 1 isoform X6 [Chiloscyllium punctatum]|uniref:SRC kinase signaling inhibitor 1 isoform X6 n=1 Tax=Chiloscyllium punctatum TaxID=137246 RepID=UPI003B641E7C
MGNTPSQETCLLPAEPQSSIAIGNCEGVCDPLAHLPGWSTWNRDFSMTPLKLGSYKYKTTYNHPPVTQDSDKSSSHMISADDAEYPREYRTLGNGTRRFSNVGLVHTSERRHTVIAAQSLEALTGMQKSDMERKREAFLDHLKHKYPHHATAIRGQQERLREQQGFEAWSACEFRDGGNKIEAKSNYWSFKPTRRGDLHLINPEKQAKTRSPRHSQSQQSGLADQAAKLPFASAESLETMSEAEVPIGFTRSNRFRQSLPLSRSTSQTKLRSPGVLFLQFGDETRRVHVTHEIGSLDTLHALIVHMFPQKLTMGMLKSPNTAILIKDETRNVFYELEDVRDIQERSIIKIFRKDPVYAPYPSHASHITNGDLRREMVYTSRESSPSRRLSSVAAGSPHLVPGSPGPGLPSSSPSRSRMSYSGGRPPSYTGSPVHHPERLGSMPPSQSISPSPSAILERRDVKPDEDMSNKNVVLMKNEGLYADPYAMMADGRLSIASTQSLAGMQDPFSFPGGLYRRGSMRSLSTYSAAGLQADLEDAFYKPSAQIYGDSYGTGLGYRMAPSSPQKMTDSRMADIQQGQSPHSPYSGPPSRSSPVRQPFRKEPGSAVVMDSMVTKSRNANSTAATEALPGPGERTGASERPASGYSSPLAVNDPETRERMEAMEKQIASLTGLVQNALLRGSEGEPASDKSESINGSSGTGTLSPSVRSTVNSTAAAPAAATTSISHPTAITRLQMQLHLHDLQQNASDLRNQLQQLRKLQVQSQDTMKNMMKRLESEISIRVTETLRKQEDPLHRQRALVEEERQKYLNDEEMIVQQLNDLEKAVDDLQRDSNLNQKLITVQELEDKALVLRQLGETLTELKAQFPSLQSKMRVILRVEVEAVKFLKEEPHRLDILLKRCKTVTDALATLRRPTNETPMRGIEEVTAQSPKHSSTESYSRNSEFEIPTSPPLNFQEQNTTGVKIWQNHNPAMAQLTQNSPAHAAASQNPSGMGQGIVTHSNSLEEAPITPSKRNMDQTISVEAAERDWEEKRASLTQFSNKDINRLLEETQVELMKAIPDLGFANKPKTVVMLTAESKQTKPQHTQKTVTKMDPNGRRHSEELTVHKYRTEKPSKSPPPPPPRRSFPSSHGLTTGRTGEVIVTNKKESTLKKADSDETDAPRPHVKLRRTMSEAKPPSTPPPIVASAVRDDEDEENRIMAELEVFQRNSVPFTGSNDQGMAAFPTPDPRPCRVSLPSRRLKGSGGIPYSEETEASEDILPGNLATEWEIDVPCSPSPLQLPQIVFTELTSGSCTPTVEVMEQEGTAPTATHDSNMENGETAGRGLGSVSLQGQLTVPSSEAWAQLVPSAIVLEEFMMIEAALRRSDQTRSQSPPPDRENPKAKEILEEILENPAAKISTGEAPCIGDAAENVAFMITENQIQALSRREVQEIVSEKGEDIHTWSVSSVKEDLSGDPSLDPSEGPSNGKGPLVSLDSKPVVVIFEEPMDIKTAYKRLSTVFEEYDEEFQTMLGEKASSQQAQTSSIPFEEQMATLMLSAVSEGVNEPSKEESIDCTSVSESEGDLKHGDDTASDEKALHSIPNVTSPETGNDNSKNVKIRFPKQRLNALTKAIESGSKTGRKILQVVVYEEEEKINKVTGERQMEVKKYELNQIEQNQGRTSKTQNTSTGYSRSEEIKNSTYKTMDSLEETIRELESTITEISQHPSSEFTFAKECFTVPDVNEPGEEPVEEPVEEPGEEPVEGPGEEPVEGPGGEPVEGPGEEQCPAACQPDVEKEDDVPILMDQPSSSLRSPSPSLKVKPALLPKPQLPPTEAKTGSNPSLQSRIAIPASPKLKQPHSSSSSSSEKLKHNKQREEYLRLQSQQGSQQFWDHI